MNRSSFVVVFLLTVAFSDIHAAENPDNSAQARDLFVSGTTHYNLTEYANALSDFREAYRLVHDPALLYNIAQCFRQLHEYAQAAQFYRSYRRESPDAPNRPEIDRLIEQMDAATKLPTAAEPSAPSPTTSTTTTKQPSAVVTPTVAEPAPIRARHRNRAWVWGVVAGTVVVAGAAVAVGIVFGSRDQYPTASFGTFMVR